jgi:integrase
MARLKTTGKSLDDVFRWFFETYEERKQVPAPPDLLEAYQAELKRLNRTPKYIAQCLSTLDVFFAAVPSINAVHRENVLPFIQGNGYSPATQRYKLVTLKAFLEWCVSTGHLASNPLSGAKNRIRIAKDQSREILSLGTEDAKRLLATASRPEHIRLAGWLALALFAGVRPDEIARTRRDCLHLEEGTFKVTAKASKTSQTRVLELPRVAILWLRHWSAQVSPQEEFTVSGHRKRWERLRADAGLGENWVHDVLRHTFASMHYAAYQNAAQLKALMGHSQGENTLSAHYRAVQTIQGATLTRAMATEFWELYPEKFVGAGPGRKTGRTAKH